MVLGSIFSLITLACFFERRRISNLRKEREDTICDFRKAFDLHEVDPWIVRAAHEAFGAWIDTKRPSFPIRAGDSMERDLKMDPEDIWDLILEVAQRAGYDVSAIDANPLLGKILTVHDVVLFINHQPKSRGAADASSKD
jgi:hypothetical protein